MKRKVHPEAYDFALTDGFTVEEVEEADEQLVIGLYEVEEYNQGRGKLTMTDVVINESGNKTLSPRYKAYIGETREQVLIREAAEHAADGDILNERIDLKNP